MLVVDVLPVLFRQLIMSNTQQSGVIIAPEFQFDIKRLDGVADIHRGFPFLLGLFGLFV